MTRFPPIPVLLIAATALTACDGQRPPPLTGLAPPTVDPEEQRRLQELDAARLSTLFTEAQTVPRGGTAATPTLPATGTLFPSSPNTQMANDPVSSREAFLTGAGNTDTVSTERITPPHSPYILQAGTVIPAALITG